MAKPATLDYGALTEADLASRARQRDRSAFREITRRCNQRLFRAARGILRDDDEAEDVVQEAYAHAFAAITGFRGEASLSTWLTRIVINEGRARLRARRVTVELSEVEGLQVDGAELRMVRCCTSVDDPERAAANSQARRLLEQAIDGLPACFRVVFILREVEDCTVEETAVTLGIKPQTVRSRLHRARRLLRQALDTELSGMLSGAYPFLGARCARITEAVLARLGGRGGRLDEPPDQVTISSRAARRSAAPGHRSMAVVRADGR
jgi:RNA polymerase sigma-70 factor (ECF subfamily)